MQLDLKIIRENAEKATTEDLLDRVTVMRTQMEPEAVAIFEQVLFGRGVGQTRISEYGLKWNREVIRSRDGTALCCSICSRPAVAQGWGWHRWRGGLPMFPRWFRYCTDHKPANSTPSKAKA